MKRVILIIVLLFLSCQKDYYLDDLNDALSQVSNLKIENSSLKSQIQQISNQKIQLDNLINDLNNDLNEVQTDLTELNDTYNALNSSYNQLLESQQTSLEEINEFKAQIVELANQLRIQDAKNNPISNGYYHTKGYARKVNDSLVYNSEINRDPVLNLFDIAFVVKIENELIVEDHVIRRARYYWDLENNNFEYLRHRDYRDRDYTYKDKLGSYMHVNEFTGDSLPYVNNYKVLDRDIFTWDLVIPKSSSNLNRTVYKNVSYKLFTEEYEIIDGVVYPPVTDLSYRSYFDNINSFEEIDDVYNYETNSNFFSDSIYAMIEQDNPKSYLQAFIKDAERYGVDLSNVDPNKLITEPWYTPTYKPGKENWIAWGRINCSRTENVIGYDNTWFENNYLTDKKFDKLKTMYHEFGHTVLGLKHTCAKNQIMYSTSTINQCQGEEIDEFSYYDNINEFKRAVKNMFEGYNQFYHDCYLNTSNNIIHIE